MMGGPNARCGPRVGLAGSCCRPARPMSRHGPRGCAGALSSSPSESRMIRAIDSSRQCAARPPLPSNGSATPAICPHLRSRRTRASTPHGARSGIGAVSPDEGKDVAAFQYDADFARSGIELAPVTMPLSERVSSGRLYRRGLEACAKAGVMKRGRAATIIEEVRAAVARWPAFAAEARLADHWRDEIQMTFRLSFPQK